jgi:hypothetical protein
MAIPMVDQKWVITPTFVALVNDVSSILLPNNKFYVLCPFARHLILIRTILTIGYLIHNFGALTKVFICCHHSFTKLYGKKSFACDSQLSNNISYV